MRGYGNAKRYAEQAQAAARANAQVQAQSAQAVALEAVDSIADDLGALADEIVNIKQRIDGIIP